MTEVQKRQYPTTVSADEFHALPDVVQPRASVSARSAC